MTIREWFRSGLALAILGSPALAQHWEVGALGGGGFYLNNSVTGSRGTGTVGFQPGFSAGGWLGHHTAGRFGGEIRYLFQKNDLKVAGPSQTLTFGGQSHLIHYDFVIHTRSSEDRVRPYFAAGGGMKGYFGTGQEHAFQPLSNIAVPTHTSQWRPVVSFGAGVKWAIRSRLMLRAEVRDYVTQFPKDVIFPAPGNRIGGWAHDITPLIGLSYIFY